MSTQCQARALDCRCAVVGPHIQTAGQDRHDCGVCGAAWMGTYGEHDFDPRWLPFSLRLSRYGKPPLRWTA